MTTTDVRVVRSYPLTDPTVQPMLDELAVEYLTRYAEHFTPDDLRAELERYPAEQFEAPDGDLILILEDGVPVAGGAFRLRAEPELGVRGRGSAAPARATRTASRRSGPPSTSGSGPAPRTVVGGWPVRFSRSSRSARPAPATSACT